MFDGNTKRCFNKSPVHLPDLPQGRKHSHITLEKISELSAKHKTMIPLHLSQQDWQEKCEVLEFTNCICQTNIKKAEHQISLFPGLLHQISGFNKTIFCLSYQDRLNEIGKQICEVGSIPCTSQCSYRSPKNLAQFILF